MTLVWGYVDEIDMLRDRKMVGQEKCGYYRGPTLALMLGIQVDDAADGFADALYDLRSFVS
jgi:hypothetical protein